MRNGDKSATRWLHEKEVVFDGLVFEDGCVTFSVHVAESVGVVLQGVDVTVRLLEFVCIL